MNSGRCLIIGEIGINHNGDVKIAKDLITAAAQAGCDVVKLQKRTIRTCFTPEQLARPCSGGSPFGPTYGDQKRGLEFGEDEYLEINSHARAEGIQWTASCWDVDSVDFIEQFDPPFYKIASASLTDDTLLKRIRQYDRPVVLSTGMSTLDEIDHAVRVLDPRHLTLLHCTSSYPTPPNEINLAAIKPLHRRYGLPVGFSSHEQGTAATLAAVALGACVIERHITLDKTMWGTDQAVSLEPDELVQMINDIRTIEAALGDGKKRVYDSELPVLNKLRNKQ